MHCNRQLPISTAALPRCAFSRKTALTPPCPISQDIQDYLDNPVAYALLSNSEFVIMLRQSKSLEALERLYGLSKPQLEFLRNASDGHGIIKMGNSMIPFSNLEPKDTAVYKLITTKPGEATAEK